MILASASPRRAMILAILRIPFEVDPPSGPEVARPGEPPLEHALRLSREKAREVADRRPGRWVLAGDTIVTLDGEILGKPQSADDALQMLLRLQGRTHRVISALSLIRPATGRSFRKETVFAGTETTAVTFRSFGRETASAYVRTGEPDDKAGAYGIQGIGAALVRRIEGDYGGVVGLPVPLLLDLLEEAGRPYRFGAALGLE